MKKKFLRNIFASILACSMLTMSVSAETQEINYDSTTDTTTRTQTTDCVVEVEKAEIYCVKLPKYVKLDGSSDIPTYTYTVEVLGEISTGNFVRVIPLEGAYIETEVGDTADLTITQDVVKWTADEVLAGDSTTGTMVAESLNPGKYSGVVQFFVSLDDGYFYKDATCTTAKLRVAQDLNDNGVQDVDETLDTPIAVGKALGHAYDGEHTFEFACTRCHQTVYEVSTPQELVDFSSAVASGNTFSGLEVNLINDIDMYDLTSVTAFTPIGNGSCVFSGTFNGNNHKISGMAQLNSFATTVSPNTYSGVSGLFGCVKDAYIKNLIYSDSNITVNALDVLNTQYGCVVGYVASSVTLENVRVTDVTTTVVVPGNLSSVYTGPFIARINSGPVSIINCAATGVTTIVDARLSTTNNGAFTHWAYKFGYMSGGTINVSNSYAEIVASHISTSASTKSVVDLTGSYYSSNTVFSNLPYQTTGTNCVALTDDELKSQTGVDLLNTGYDTPVWKLDLLNENNGYPIQII